MMNKKNITIDTQLYDDGVEAKLGQYHTQQAVSRSTQKVYETQTGEHIHQSSVPYVKSQIYQQILHDSFQQQYDGHQLLQTSTRKLQSANLFENIISRAMASLFVRCWEELKALLPQYQYLVMKHSFQNNHEIIEGQNNVFNHESRGENAENTQVNKVNNVFATNLKSVDQRKKEILERQNKGITLSSLQKQKLSRSKSLNKINAQRDAAGSLKLQESKQSVLNAQDQDKQVSRISRKSYRQKFLQYKHRSRSKDAEIKKTQTYTKFLQHIDRQKSLQKLPSNLYNPYSTSNLVSHHIRPVYSASNIQQSKNALLKNINDLLIDREDIYQGEDYRYYINHRDSLRNVHNNQEVYMKQYPESSLSKANLRFNYAQSTDIQTDYNEQHQMLRAKLLQDIVMKLNCSKLRLQQLDKSRSQDLDLERKIDRLQKTIVELRLQTSNQLLQPSNLPKSQVIYVNSATSQEQQLYKKFLDQISTIRTEINMIKNINQPSYQPPSIIVDNSLSHAINEQQKLLEHYKREYEKLLNQKQRGVSTSQNKKQVSTVKQNVQITTTQHIEKTQTAPKSIFEQLLEKGKNSQNRVGWNDGWEQQKQQVQKKQQHNYHNASSNMQRTRRRNQHMYRDETYQKYRYTRNQILEDIGMRAQIQQQQRIWRQNQIRQRLDRQRRQEEVRIMTQKVKLVKQQEYHEKSDQQNMNRTRPIRQKYQEEWENYQKSRIDFTENQNTCCALFPC